MAGALAGEALGFARRASEAVLDLLLPPRCFGCRGPVDAQGGICPTCWGALTFLGPPCCACCGHPFEYEAGPNALCGACLRARPDYDRARAVMRYDDASRELVLAFKHRDRIEAASPYGVWLARAGRELVADADILAPIPLHWTRLFARRY